MKREKKISSDEAIDLIKEDPLRYAGQRLSTVPVGTAGIWRVSRFTVSPTEALVQRLRVVDGLGARAPREGEYTVLSYRTGEERKGKPVYLPMMSDTQAEMADHIPAIKNCAGNVLVTGLGLGVITDALMLRWEVRSVTVIEKDPDVIKLVADHLVKLHHASTKPLRILCADAFTWETDQKFDTAWHDIWPTLKPESLPEMRKLRKRYPTVWTGCWSEPQAKAMAAFDRNPSHETALRAISGF